MTGDPTGLLIELSDLRKRARVDRHGYWLPFLLFGLITLGATPFYVPEYCRTTGACVADEPWLYHWLHPDGRLNGPIGSYEPTVAADIYWIIALLCGYLAVVWWYRWRAAQVGVETPTRLYAQVTIFTLLLPLVGVPVLSKVFFNQVGWQIALPITVVAIVAATWTARRRVVTALAVLALFGLAHFIPAYPYGQMFVLAAGLAGLAWVERSAVCTVFVALFAAAVVFVNEAGRFDLHWPYQVEQYATTGLPAVVLLVGGIIGSVRREMAR
ncbi:hypothetical protein ABZX92_06605 [Lentzea sp. NPDC006480]|uniref:hypothetical protein n=1 Tax=Lentzea sp. NPDC006480 TaxID=3157176 RepID=UPI0033AFF198